MQTLCIHRVQFLVILLSVTACLPGPGFFKQNSSIQSQSVETTINEAIGKEVASIKAGTSLTQEVKVSSASPVVGTTVSFPPGALMIDTEIAIEEAAPVATNLVAAELGMGENIVSSGVSVSVQATTNMDAVQPFKLAIPLPSSLGLTWLNQFENLVVMYKVKKATEDNITVGLIPRQDISIENGAAVFLTKHFGAFQVALTKELVTERKEAVVETPILTKQDVAKLPAITIASRAPFVVGPKDRVEIRGTNFRPSMMIALAGRKVNGLQVTSDVSASFIAPEYEGFGLANLSVEQDGVSQTVAMMYTGSKDDLPVITLAPAEVCSGQRYYDRNGKLQTGTKTCSDTNLSNLNASDIRSGVTIAGVTGTLTPAPAACNTNGQTSCVTTNTYKAADLSNLDPSHILDGMTIAGVTGTLTVGGGSYSSCTADGETNCIASTGFPAADAMYLNSANIKSGITIGGTTGALNPAPSDCATDGGTGCVATSSFPAVMTSGLASKVISGETVAGISGNVVLPIVDHVLQGISYGTNGTNFTGILTLPDPTNVVAGSPTYGDPTSPMTPSYTVDLPDLANVRAIDTVSGMPGTLMDCNTDGQTGCFTQSSFPAVNLANVTPGNIRNGVNIAGINGQYPSSIHPLSGSTATPDLDSATFNIKIKSMDTFEYWSSDGTRYEGTGDIDIAAANISSTIDIFGTTGTIPPPACSFPGQTSCEMDTACRWTGSFCEINPWHIRKDIVIAGQTGALTFYKNMVGTYDRSGGVGALVGVDVFDTIDDYNNAASFPTTNPTDWDSANGGNWTEVVASTTYKDEISGLVWTADQGSLTWESAIGHCDGLNYGGRTDWRLPTQKELQLAYVNGIWSRKIELILNPSYYWSATTDSGNTTSAHSVKLGHGSATINTKSMTAYVICVAN